MNLAPNEGLIIEGTISTSWTEAQDPLEGHTVNVDVMRDGEVVTLIARDPFSEFTMLPIGRKVVIGWSSDQTEWIVLRGNIVGNMVLATADAAFEYPDTVTCTVVREVHPPGPVIGTKVPVEIEFTGMSGDQDALILAKYDQDNNSWFAVQIDCPGGS